MPTLEVNYRAVSLHVAISIYEIAAVFYRFEDMDASQNFKMGHCFFLSLSILAAIFQMDRVSQYQYVLQSGFY